MSIVFWAIFPSGPGVCRGSCGLGVVVVFPPPGLVSRVFSPLVCYSRGGQGWFALPTRVWVGVEGVVSPDLWPVGSCGCVCVLGGGRGFRGDFDLLGAFLGLGFAGNPRGNPPLTWAF